MFEAKETEIVKVVLVAVADLGFPRRGPQPIIWQFKKKKKDSKEKEI